MRILRKIILIHYGELGLKGSNKPYFVSTLISNIKNLFAKNFKKSFSVNHVLGRILILSENEKEEEIKICLKRIPGIKNFQFVFESDENLENLLEDIFNEFNKNYGAIENLSFCVRVKRSQKMYLNSSEIEKKIGEYVVGKMPCLRAKMKSPDVLVNVEFFNHKAYFSFLRHEGVGGLPVGTGARLLALISGGIDSPVAAFQMMRRGAKISFVHFDGYPFSDDAEKENIKALIKILNDYQVEGRVYFVAFGQYQKLIASNVNIPAKFRVVIYRRLMLRIAEKIASREKCKGLVTGDSYGQVASQTPENLRVIHNVVCKLPLYQPLISFDKEEIISISREIGTYDISILPCHDTCQMFNPKNPEINAKLKDVIEAEKNIPIDDWVEDALRGKELIKIS